MKPIRRAGPPRARGLRGNVFTWSVSLSAVPSDVWMAGFREAEEWASVCHPEEVTIADRERLLIFESEEAHVPTWIQCIDKWIEAANEAVARREEEMRQRAAHDEEARERLRRIQEVTEKFKNL